MVWDLACILKINIKNILNPYFTTKAKRYWFRFAIVNKIINDHNGSINFISINEWSKNRN